MRSLLAFLALSLAPVLLAIDLGCGSTPCDNCGGAGGGSTTASSTGKGGGGGAPCDPSRGTLAGSVYQFAGPGQPNGPPVPKALVALRQNPSDPPTYAMADEQGHYSVDIPVGVWIVSGEDGAGCFTDGPQNATIEACSETRIDLVLDVCAG